MNYFYKSFFISLVVVLFLGCSEDAEYTSPTSLYIPTVTGSFIDDAVEGLSYSCSSGESGVTNSDGNYTCTNGDDVTFTLGSLTLGTIAAQSGAITPYSLYPTDIPAAINLARLLQTLADTNSSTNILLDTALVVLVPADTNFSSSSYETDIQNALAKSLVSVEDALRNLNESVLNEGGEIPDGGNIPVADAGDDINSTIDDLITLDGSGSYDVDTNATLTYEWSFTQKPQDSNATLSESNISQPTFVTDVNGTYVLSLVVYDGMIHSSADTVRIVCDYIAPVATFSTFSLVEDANYSGVLSATDENNDTLTFSLVSSVSHGTLTLDANGSFSYIPTPNYSGIDSFIYKVFDGVVYSEDQNVTITISAQNDAPTIALSTPLSVAENQTHAFDINASDADNDTLIYSVSGSDASSFECNATTGVVNFLSAPNYEVKNSYSLSVAVSDSNATTTLDVVLNITDVAEPAILEGGSMSVDENSPATTSVGAITIVSSGDSAISSITLSGTGSSNFEVSTAGALSVKAGATLDYETTPLYTLSAVATSASGESNVVDVNISINNVAEVAPGLLDTTLAIREDIANGSVIGNVGIATTGDTNITSITLSGTGNENFSIDTEGVVSLASNATIDYETTTSYTLSVIATNDFGPSAGVTLMVYVNNIIDTPPTLAASTGSILENAVAATAVGNVTISDAGDSAITAMELSGIGSDYFSIDITGAVTLSQESILDFETMPTYILGAIATNEAGESASVDFTVSVTDYPFTPKEFSTIVSSDLETNDYFGISVGVSGDYFIVGADGEDMNGDSGRGSAYLFKRDANASAIQLAKLSASDGAAGDYFGKSVAIDGDFNVVGAYRNISQGAAYLFEKTSDISTTQVAKILSDDIEADDNFGWSVAISGDYIVVGAYLEDASGVSNSGSAYLFKKDENNTITQLAKLSATSPSAESNFGYSVAIDGDYIVVGSHMEDGSSTIDSGAAYIYKRNTDTNITLVQRIEAPTPVANAYFGNSAAISGDYIVIGAYNEDTTSTQAGRAYLFKRSSDSSITYIDTLDAGADIQASAYFGYSVAISANHIMVGAAFEDTTTSDEGAVYSFEIDTANDTLSAKPKVTASDSASGDNFGYSVAIDTDTIVVGSPFSDASVSDGGKSYLYDAEPLGVAP